MFRETLGFGVGFLFLGFFFVSCDHLLSEWVCSDGVNGAVLYRNLKGVSRLLVCVHKLSRKRYASLCNGVI